MIQPESGLNQGRLDRPFEGSISRYEWEGNGYEGQVNGGVMQDAFDVGFPVLKCVGAPIMS